MNRSSLFALTVAIVAFACGWYVGGDHAGAPERAGIPVAISYSGGFAAASSTNRSSVSNAKSAPMANRAAPATAVRSAVATRLQAGNTLRVNSGDSIQSAVMRAQPGDTIQVMPGNYSETVYIDKDDIHLIGIIVEGRRATLDGLGELNDAILYSGNNIVIENFKIIGYKGNGIMSQAGNNFEIRNNIIVDTGIYGIFPQLSKNGLIEHNIISGIADAAIYVGMSDNIHVAYNEVFDSVAGIEIENSRYAIVEHNHTHHNSGGILAFITPGLPIKDASDIIIRNNFILDNNTANFAVPGSTVAGIPAGTGILIMAADDVVVEGNIISNNKTAGILITDHGNAGGLTLDPLSEPHADRAKILDNVMLNNGYDTIDEVKAFALTELHLGNIDIFRIGPSEGSCILNRHRYATVGVGDFTDCDFNNTDNIATYLLPMGAKPRVIASSERGEIAYLGICAGCHSYTGRLIGPPVPVIQALYRDNPEALADYMQAPVKKRSNFPEMPPQNYLDRETQLAVAEYMLSIDG
ncbi:MAG: right-handed parallel beta-helix repeat-containing protein [Porticoccaceae bacterium]|nr:right-handed parallel beta-helix repeat-containing protein [Porticoccaceae bacterium]